MKTTWLDSRKDDIRSAELESESRESDALEKEGSTSFEVSLEQTGINLGGNFLVFWARLIRGLPSQTEYTSRGHSHIY